MTRIQRITALLEAHLGVRTLEIRDESARHIGHAGHTGGTETHLVIWIEAAALDGLPRVAQHRRIYDLIAPEFSTGLHAVTLHAGPRENRETV